MDIDPRLLPAFVVLAEELHFTKASQRLYIAQPALSQQIRRLEAQLGFELFDRTTRRVELTRAGELFLPGARRALDVIGEAVAEGRAVAAQDASSSCPWVSLEA